MEKKREILDICKKIPVFNGFQTEDFEKVIGIMKPKTVKAEELIISEGEQGSAMFLIRDGSVSVTKNGDGEEVYISELGKGAFFGELSLFDNLPRSANVRAIDDTDIFKLSRVDFEELLNGNVNLANLFYKNCMTEIFARFRNALANFTFSQNVLKEKTESLQEISKDLDTAKKLQDYFIDSKNLGRSSEKNFSSNIKHSYVYDPCIAIGGDFLNIIKIGDNRTAVIIADFEGHGISAALGTGVLKSALSLMPQGIDSDPRDVMAYLNNHFVEVIHELYATCYMLVIDNENDRVDFVKAGHHHPLFWHEETQTFVEVECPGTALGLIEGAQFGISQYQVKKGDKILLFTDGIIEQRNDKDKMYSLKRLKEKFKYSIIEHSKSIVIDLHNDMKIYAGDEAIEDDVTLFLLEFN